MMVWNVNNVENLFHTARRSIPSFSPRFSHSTTAAMRPLPIERALKTDILTISGVIQHAYTSRWGAE